MNVVLLPDIGLIALDLDGTLLDARDDVSPDNRRALQAALQAGIRIVFVTGRGAVDVPPELVAEFHGELPVICAHGAVTKEFHSGRTLGHIPVPTEHALPVIEHAQRHGLNVAVYLNDTFLHLHGTVPQTDDVRAARWIAVPSLAEALAAQAPTFMRFFGRETVGALQAAFSELPLHFRHEVWDAFEECAVTSALATKERALQQLCAEIEMPASRVLAIGDSRNDVPMLLWAGTGVAMGNALPEVRQAVTHVTARYDEDGVARAIERHVLNPIARQKRSA